jgi:hypothetical protein
MPPSPSEGGDAQNNTSQTLAELLLYLPTPRRRQELEEYRIAYEAQFGETDLKTYYVSMWPKEQREWLLEHHPKRYWDSLPPFIQSYFKEKMKAVHREGKLDDAPHSFLSLYLKQQMIVSDEGRQR